MPNWAYNTGEISFKKMLSDEEKEKIKNKIGSTENCIDFRLIMPYPKLTTKCQSNPIDIKLIRHWYYNFSKIVTEEQIQEALGGKLSIGDLTIDINEDKHLDTIHKEIIKDLSNSIPAEDYVEEIHEWHTWQRNKWGTKWNSSGAYLNFQENDGKSELCIYFETAWGISEELIYELIRKVDSVVEIELAQFKLREEFQSYAYDIEAYKSEGELSFCYGDVRSDIMKEIDVKCPNCKHEFEQEIDVEDETVYLFCDECDSEFQITYDNGKILY